MLRLYRRSEMAMAVLVLGMAADASAQQLLETDGVELLGEAQLAIPNGGTCNVLESDTAYETRRENDGAPMDIWRLDFSVHNGSGRWLDHLISRFQIESEWPECTNWDRVSSAEIANVAWSDSIDSIQRSGRNVVGPNETLTQIKYFIVLQGDPPPRFSNWSVDFDFAATPPPAGTAADTPAATTAAPNAPRRAMHPVRAGREGVVPGRRRPERAGSPPCRRIRRRGPARRVYSTGCSGSRSRTA